MADGLIVRSDIDGIIIDLDKDGDERTGWVLFYLHTATQDRIQVEQEVNTGDFLGLPSCEGGSSTEPMCTLHANTTASGFSPVVHWHFIRELGCVGGLGSL